METQKQFKRRFSFEFFRPRPTRAGKSYRACAIRWPRLTRISSPVTFGAGIHRDRTVRTVLDLHKRGVSTAPHHPAWAPHPRQHCRNCWMSIATAASTASSPCVATCHQAWAPPVTLRYANELVSFIREVQRRYLNIEVAAYPEFTPGPAPRRRPEELNARKVEAGANSAITQASSTRTATSTLSTVWRRWALPFQWCRALCPSSTSPT